MLESHLQEAIVDQHKKQQVIHGVENFLNLCEFLNLFEQLLAQYVYKHSNVTE